MQIHDWFFGIGCWIRWARQYTSHDGIKKKSINVFLHDVQNPKSGKRILHTSMSSIWGLLKPWKNKKDQNVWWDTPKSMLLFYIADFYALVEKKNSSRYLLKTGTLKNKVTDEKRSRYMSANLKRDILFWRIPTIVLVLLV